MAKEQEHKRTQRREATEPETQAPAEQDAGASSVDALKGEMDAILDEIDAVLEENAEEFVKGYVQKGGE